MMATSPSTVRVSRKMRLLTTVERRKFLMQTHAQEGEEVVSVNEINTDQEDEQINLPLWRTERSKYRREERPRKRRKLPEVAETEERERMTVPINFKSFNARARTKVKPRQLILEADRSTESKAAASQGHTKPEAGVELNVIPLLRYFNSKFEKYVGTTNNGSYLELVRNRSRTKVATTSAAAAKQRQLQEREAKYEILRKRLAEEVELRSYSEKTCEGLGEDIEITRCATFDLRDRLEASRVEFNMESRRVDELTAASEKKEQAHAAELAAKVKTLPECEAAKISDLELIEKLEAQCNELRSQRSQAEEQLYGIGISGGATGVVTSGGVSSSTSGGTSEDTTSGTSSTAIGT
ncbi:hypothetical protein AXG93_2356s1070 [Marchantia polymorpha subsp. ruderalis]|uniref:Uncharacterized protein n=1 Tax=Marchantia polymorpha subsp. ruderalis TaxID=1480154 RepID=A0A176WFX2_MARPO|nr:hypothetical protein AXG93_2356s1070 [Marchantia polymorpha subsp. ruderalis]